MTDIKLKARTSHPMLYTDRLTERFIEVSIETAISESGQARPPLNIALVLDRSGSMSGDKFQRARHAADHILGRLTARDRVAIIVYDDQIDVVAESAFATTEHIRQCRDRLNGISPRNMTNLFEGWLRGCDQVAGFRDKTFVSRTLLLTDGLANVGTTDHTEIARHAGALFERGVSTSTFGIGTDFDEDLLSRMADAGGGRFRYIEHAGHITDAFREEFVDLASVIARGAVLRVSKPTTGSIQLLGGIPHESSRESVIVSVGDLYAGEERPYYFRVRTDGGEKDAALTIPSKLTAISTDETSIELSASVELRFAGADAVAAVSVDEQLMRRAADVDIADARMEAIRLYKMGRFREAGAAFQLAAMDHADFREPSELADDRSFSASLSAKLDPVELKKRQAEAYLRSRRRDKR